MLPAIKLDWSKIDTVLLDMDGTLIDLHFDNVLWNSHLPETYAQTQQMSVERARELLFAQMSENARTIEFYCIDHWTKFTGLDIMQLHHNLANLLRFRDGTENFLRWLQDHPARTLMATNAHRSSLTFKSQHIDMLGFFDGIISSHDYQQVKESQDFWTTLIEAEGIDPKRALFVDDNENVLEAAAQFGVGQVVCVASPDSCREPRTDSAYPMVHSLEELLPLKKPSK